MDDHNKDLIRCRTVLEVIGKPKEHVESTLKGLIDQIKQNPDLSILKEDYAEIKPHETTMFSTYVELEMVVKGITTLTGFCFDYMPSSLEIDKPSDFNLKKIDVTNVINDLQAKLHKVDMAFKQLRVENDVLVRNFKTSVTNTITILIKLNKNTIEDLSKFSGIQREELDRYLNALIDEGKIKKEEDRYLIA